MVGGNIFHAAGRMFRFGIVGVLATLTHACFSVGALKLLDVPPVVANGIGFLVAFCVSMAGHALFTFRTHMSVHRALKFTLVALSAVIISSSIVLLADAYTTLAHARILVIAAVSTPAFSFVCHSLWTFRRQMERAGA
jgi:putative flippase GtrA